MYSEQLEAPRQNFIETQAFLPHTFLITTTSAPPQRSTQTTNIPTISMATQKQQPTANVQEEMAESSTTPRQLNDPEPLCPVPSKPGIPIARPSAELGIDDASAAETVWCPDEDYWW